MTDHDSETPHTPTDNDPSWSSDDQITTDDIEETFDQCPQCGRYIVLCNDAHYCGSTEYRPNPSEQERRRRIKANPFPDDDPVLILKQPASKAYAYHEPDSKDKPLCSSRIDESFRTLSRAQAHDQLQVPCQTCQRYRQKREADR